jgi:hypothetical protein
MPRKPAHHVVTHGDGWAVKKEGAARVSSQHATKREAESAGRTTSRNQGTELIVHKKDGTIERRDSHGDDPYPPKG